MRRRPIAALGAVVALVLSAGLGLLAADVLRTERALGDGDARLGSGAGAPGMWDAETTLPAGVSRTLLAVDDDLEFRTAIQRFRFVRPREPVTRFAQVTRRSGAERALARAARRESDELRRSALSNLRGALALEEARLGANAGPPLRRAAVHFRRAVEIDPSNDDARFNLELALRLLTRAAASSAGSGERRATPASGAGAASSGSGY